MISKFFESFFLIFKRTNRKVTFISYTRAKGTPIPIIFYLDVSKSNFIFVVSGIFRSRTEDKLYFYVICLN